MNFAELPESEQVLIERGHNLAFAFSHDGEISRSIRSTLRERNGVICCVKAAREIGSTHGRSTKACDHFTEFSFQRRFSHFSLTALVVGI